VWKVILSPEFKQEIRDIHSYIANTLLVPETALKQVGRIIGAAESLNEMPARHSLYEKEPWRG
jgi:toxin ParE1/3/4